MYSMFLNDDETYSDIGGCHIVYVPDDFDGEVDYAVRDVLRERADDTEGIKVLTKFSEYGLFTDEEIDLIKEGLNYCEENGAPSMGWRGGTKKIEAVIESIESKLI